MTRDTSYCVGSQTSIADICVIPQLFLGLLAPLPVRYRLYFGEPLTFEGDPDDDDAVVEEKVWVVKATIQSLINRGLEERPGLFT